VCRWPRWPAPAVWATDGGFTRRRTWLAARMVVVSRGCTSPLLLSRNHGRGLAFWRKPACQCRTFSTLTTIPRPQRQPRRRPGRRRPASAECSMDAATGADVSIYDRLVLMVIASHARADQGGRRGARFICVPRARERLAESSAGGQRGQPSGSSPATRLEQAGLLTVEQNRQWRGHRTIYRLRLIDRPAGDTQTERKRGKAGSLPFPTRERGKSGRVKGGKCSPLKGGKTPSFLRSPHTPPGSLSKLPRAPSTYSALAGEVSGAAHGHARY